MEQNKVKKCKYPKCVKEVYSKKSVFCLQHSRELKDKGKNSLAVVGGMVAIGVTAIINGISSKK